METHEVVARSGRSYGLLPNEGRPLRAEQDPAIWVDAARDCIADILSAGGLTPVSIGCSGQQHGMVLVDEADAVVRPAKLW